MNSEIRSLENLNDFPRAGLIYYENSGENLLKDYLEKIFKVNVGSNIIKDNTNNIESHWIIKSDYPLREDSEYLEACVSSAILLVRNPIDVIMSKLLKDSVYLEEALGRVDEYIQTWKAFYKYWFNAPIPVFIVRYEDLISSPYDMLQDLCKFLLGIKCIENSKLDYSINICLKENPSKTLYAYDIELSENNEFLGDEKSQSIRGKFEIQLNKIMIKLNYEVGVENVENWLCEFNKENLVKNVEFHENLEKQFLSTNFFALKLG
jgi:hypothetical protein